MYQILYKGKVSVVKDPYIFTTIYRLLAEKDFHSITVEWVEDE